MSGRIYLRTPVIVRMSSLGAFRFKYDSPGVTDAGTTRLICCALSVVNQPVSEEAKNRIPDRVTPGEKSKIRIAAFHDEIVQTR